MEVFQNARIELTHLAVPPARRIAGPDPHWRMPLTSTRYLTAAPVPHTALTTVLQGGRGSVGGGLR